MSTCPNCGHEQAPQQPTSEDFARDPHALEPNSLIDSLSRAVGVHPSTAAPIALNDDAALTARALGH